MKTDPVPDLKDYQRTDFNEYLARYLRGDTACVCEWDAGLGKTLLCIMLARTMDAPRMLVTGPQIAMVAWQEQLDQWWPSASYLIIRKGADIRKLRDHHRVVAVTFDLCRNDEVRTTLRDWAAGGFGVVDEAQYLRGHDSQRTGAAYGRGEGVLSHCHKVMLMSGTLIVSWPDDLWTHLARWAPERIVRDGVRMDYETFRDHVLITRRVPIPGTYAHRIQKVDMAPGAMDDLRDRLKGWSIRRTKAEAGLPPLTWRSVPMELAPADRKAIETELMDNLPERLHRVYRETLAAPQDEALALRFFEALAEYSELSGVAMRILGVGKAKAVSRYLKDRLENTPGALLIFSLNRKVMDVFDAELSKFGVVRVDGSTSGRNREAASRNFQADGGPRVFNGQIVACGTALTLTRADTCIFPQMSWLPGENHQAASRAHRIGQLHPVEALIPVAQGTLDQPLMGVLRKKTAATSALYAD